MFKRLMIGAVLALASLGAHAATVTGTFPITISGCATAVPSRDVSYIKDTGTGFTLLVLPQLTCVSNTTDMYMHGIPADLMPMVRLTQAVNVRSGGNTVPGSLILIPSLNYFNFEAWTGTTMSSFGFSATGVKGFSQPGVTVGYFSAATASP